MIPISVVIPLYNKEHEIVETLQSVLNQTYSDFEIIIVNDGSTDNSISKVNTIKDPRIKIFSKNNEGVSIARNFGVEKASFDYIAFLDADDLWYPNHLETLQQMIQKFPQQTWYATSYEKIYSKNLKTPMVSPLNTKGNEWVGIVSNFFKNSKIDSLAWTSSVGMKKSFFNSLEGFNPNITHTEDIDLWIRAALESSLVFTNKITSIYNLIANNRSNAKSILERKYTNFNKFKIEEEKNDSLKHYLDLNRYALAILYKTLGDTERFKTYKKDIRFSNLNAKQKLLMQMPAGILIALKKTQVILEKIGIRLSSF